MSIVRVEVKQQRDELGELEEFTWDLYPLVDGKQTTHLDENGLPKVGVVIAPGMILVGKIGKTRQFDPNRQPNALEIHGLPVEEVRARYGHMWINTSLYASQDTAGTVQKAYFEESSTVMKAIVELNRP
jgi:DNA-directed RNA polymerase beta subunit